MGCCNLGEEHEKEAVLHQTENFFVKPTIGQMGIEGYLLICSKQHFIGIGDVPAEHETELEELIEKTRKIVSNEYSSDVVVFEHGPRLACHKGGGCLDHAHLHLVPTDADVVGFLGARFILGKIKGFERLREIYKKAESSYLFVESHRERYVIEVTLPLPSQYIRQIIASQKGISEWDWRIYPDMKTFEKTLNRLKGKF